MRAALSSAALVVDLIMSCSFFCASSERAASIEVFEFARACVPLQMLQTSGSLDADEVVRTGAT